MGKYIQKNLTKNEEIILEAKISKLPLISAWITGILFCWLLLIPFFKAIQKTIKYRNTILGFTNKRVIGKQRGNKTITLDAPLNKVQSVGTSNTFWGRVFNYGDITIRTAAGEFKFVSVKKFDDFKMALMEQIDKYENDKIQEQAKEMAKAMLAGMGNR
ncbi:MAG: PH domain-containing protein [Bacilli bacterium]|jgi:hypothetical protein|nr:PH domain-containing protein [Bacilli bacterium]